MWQERSLRNCLPGCGVAIPWCQNSLNCCVPLISELANQILSLLTLSRFYITEYLNLLLLTQLVEVCQLSSLPSPILPSLLAVYAHKCHIAWGLHHDARVAAALLDVYHYCIMTQGSTSSSLTIRQNELPARYNALPQPGMHAKALTCQKQPVLVFAVVVCCVDCRSLFVVVCCVLL